MSIGLERKDSKDELVFPMSPERIGGGAAGLVPVPGWQLPAQPQGIGHASSRTTVQSPIKQLTPARRITPPSLKGSNGQSFDWKAMRQASDLVLQGSGHRQSNYLHACSGLNPEERLEQRKAARLSLDTSVHGKSLYRDNNVLLQRPIPSNIVGIAVHLRQRGSEPAPQRPDRQTALGRVSVPSGRYESDIPSASIFINYPSQTRAGNGREIWKRACGDGVWRWRPSSPARPT